MPTPDKVLRKSLRDLIHAIELHVNEVDEIGKMPASTVKGQRLAQAVNRLELAKDIAKRFGLKG